MPEPLKHMYNKVFITALSQSIQPFHPTFNEQQFHALIFNDSWSDKELKQRTRHITQALHTCLTKSYPENISILKKTVQQFYKYNTQLHGYECVIFSDYVEHYGLDYYDVSVPALAFFTPYPSSEFAVRPFIIKYPEKMIQQMQEWALHEDEHVRRLASEGCRPRLPWAMQLPQFIKDPTPVFEILETLKADKSLYVRRSVANNLNDISKDHPDIVLNMAKDWLGKSKETDWLVKHACRTLLKQANVEALSLFGFTPAEHIQLTNFEISPEVRWGEYLLFSADISSNEPLGMLRLEFAIDFVKTNGKTSRKIFKISESNVLETSKHIKKHFSFKPISTRKYYPGTHQLSLIINGQTIQTKTFTLLPNMES
ncbi:MAG: DNA alkylation repair protein [Ghiorsea sp.]